MDKLLFVRGQLQSRRDQFNEIAKGSGVTRRTLYNIVGSEHSPITSTVDKLFSYLQATKGQRTTKRERR
jgi:DNA-binding phage protein